MKLETEDGLLEGHNKCSEYLHKSVRKLLCCPAILDRASQNELLSLVSPVFSSDDNDMLETMPSKKEVLHALSSSNFNASSGSDGISSLVYKESGPDLRAGTAGTFPGPPNFRGPHKCKGQLNYP